MPQDSLRSVVYRSLVPCDDPNGVIEGEAIRKSKTGSHKKEHRIERHGAPKDPNRSSVSKEGKGEVFFSEGVREELHRPPSFQLLEVSKGAHKLNQMIDSWSRGNSFDGQSNDIARDLLKGALDLQESLVMLCKLQESSMDQVKRKQKQKFEEVNGIGVQRNDPYRLEERINNQRRMQNGHLLVDGSSRNSIEELKKVIGESLAKQNFLPNEEKASIRQRKLSFSSDIPSTSSSQSSMMHWNDSASVSSSVSSRAQERKAKGPCLIAKLMGLDEFPSENEERLNEWRPVANVEMANARKDYLMYRNEDPERNTLKGIIETMQFKGVLKSEDIEGVKHQSKGRMDDEMPPIVIIKPLRSRYAENEGILLRQFSGDPKDKFTETELKEESSKKGLIQGERTQDLKTLLHDEKALEFEKMNKEAESKEIPTKRGSGKKRISTSKEIGRKQEVKEPKTKERTSANKMKVSVPLKHKPQEKETTSGKPEKVHKARPNERRMMDNAKSSTMSRSKTQVTATSTKLNKNGNELATTKKCIQHHQEHTTRNATLSRSKPPVSHTSIVRPRNNSARKAKPVAESLRTTSIAENKQCKDGHKEINQTGHIESVSTPIIASLSDELLTNEVADTEKIVMEDQSEEEERSSPCNVLSQISQHGKSTVSSEESEQLRDHESMWQTTAKTEFNLQGLLLTSPSFLNCAEALFDVNINQPVVLRPTDTEDVNDRLYLDYANELIERKSHQTPVMSHPLLTIYIEVPRIKTSIDQLVQEVCDGVDSLKSYTKAPDNIRLVDTIYKMLQSDVKWTGMVAGGVWDLAWVNGFSVNEADQVVCEVESHVLSVLIEEVIVDFFPNSLVQNLQWL